jgi:hypothetical protein
MTVETLMVGLMRNGYDEVRGHKQDLGVGWVQIWESGVGFCQQQVGAAAFLGWRLSVD